MDSSAPFYKQLTPRLLTIFGFIFFSITLALLILKYRDNQVVTIIEKEVPSIERAFQQQLKYVEANQLLSAIIKSENSKNLLENHQSYITLLQQLSLLLNNKNRTVKQIKSSEDGQQEKIKRLTNNHQRNMLLQQNSLIQLQLVLDVLTSELVDKETAQAKLFQQIVRDKVVDKVTVSRAKAHADLTKVVNLLRQTNIAVKNVEVIFSRLNLQTSLEEFNYFTGELSENLALWQSQFETINSETDAASPLVELLFNLDKLLYVEQNSIAKWRGHIRLSKDYFERLSEQQLQLQTLQNQLQLPTLTTKVVPDQIASIFSNKFVISTQHLQIFILLMFSILMLSIWLLLRKFIQQIKANNEASICLVENILEGKEVDKKDEFSAEDIQLINLLSNVIKPKHSEDEYQLLERKSLSIQQRIFEHAQLAFFVLDGRNNSIGNKLALKLIFSNDTAVKIKENWLNAFAFGALKNIINTAKQAKVESKPFSCEVFTRSNKLLNVSIYYNDNTWQGVISTQDKHLGLVEDIAKLEQQAELLKSEHQKSFANNADKLSQMLIRTMLQSQSVSIGSEVTSLQVYRQLTRILDWSRQQQISAELKNDEKVKTLSNVNIRNELFAISQNIMVEANQQRNSVNLHLASNLLPRAKINVRLFHRTLLGLSRLCLMDQFKSTLQLNTEIVDKNSGQQIVRFSFQVIANKPKPLLPDLIQLFIDFNEDKNSPQIIKYLHTLLAAIHGNNALASISENGFKVSIELPIAIAESNSTIDIEDAEVNLKEASFVIASENDDFISTIESAIKKSNGNVESIKQISNVVKQLSVKRLTANAVSAVIVNSQELLNNERIIQQHLNSLPTALRPKLAVLQPFFTHDLHRHGFYEWSDSPCEPITFVEYLADFIQQESMSNLLIPAEVFSQHRFSQTQVEVLLAVECPEKHQNLSRLLYWLGLQVNIVCQADMMLKQWQTGRYLVLLTEFNDSPFINMQVGKNVNRGVFTLGRCQINQRDKKDSSNFQRWHQDKIINTQDIEHLVKLFSPWIKEKQVSLPTVRHEKSQTQTTKVEKKKNKASSAEKETVNKNKDLPQAFDLAEYAKNQGSPELAVFMLDDYLAELNNTISEISETLKAKEFNVALEKNSIVLKITTILAASDLNESAKLLEELLNKKALHEANAKLKQIVSQYQALIEFTKTI